MSYTHATVRPLVFCVLSLLLGTTTWCAADVQPTWQAKIGGQLTSLIIGGGRAYVSRIDTNTVYALDLDSGEIVWSRTVGGPVDSPPTVCGDSVVFGCRDGWVYRLWADDGQLARRFHAAPTDRQLVVEDHLESVWPVHGSVLVRNGQVCFAAGRSSYLDGGMTNDQ